MAEYKITAPAPDVLDDEQRKVWAVGITGTYIMSGKSFKGPLVDHVEMFHERELAPGTTLAQIRAMHDRMHQLDPDGEQYGHLH